MNRLIILIPTYNEGVSILDLLEKLRVFRMNTEFEFDVLVIDDNSPDGTADKTDSLKHPWVEVLRRPG